MSSEYLREDKKRRERIEREAIAASADTAWLEEVEGIEAEGEGDADETSDGDRRHRDGFYPVDREADDVARLEAEELEALIDLMPERAGQPCDSSASQHFGSDVYDVDGFLADYVATVEPDLEGARSDEMDTSSN